MTRKIHFTEICRLLEEMDFQKTMQPSHVLFEHAASNTMVVLRPYRPREVMNPVDLASVRKALDERGLMPAETFEGFFSRNPA